MKQNESRSIFIEENELADYCKEHGLSYDVMENGVRVVSISKGISDSVFASLSLTFATGSYFDRTGMAGEHHLFEHLINPPIRSLAVKRDVAINASTSYYELAEHISGPVSTDLKDYGVLSMLDAIYAQLKNPLSAHENLIKVIENEKKVVKTEIDERKANHNWIVQDTFLRSILKPNNPLLSPIAGSEESLMKIGVTDLQELFAKIFDSRILTIAIMNEGDKRYEEAIKESIFTIFKSYPRATTKQIVPNWSLLDEVQAKKPSEDIHFNKTSLRNGMSSVVFAWITDFEEFSTSEFGLKRYLGYISEKIHNYSRQNGIAYSAGAYSIYGHAKQYCVVRFDVSQRTKEQLANLVQHLKKDLPEMLQLQNDEIEEIIDIEQKRETVIPLTNENRFNWMLLGLQRYQKGIDAETVKKRHKDINKEHISQWCNFFLQNNPFISVIGDF